MTQIFVLDTDHITLFQRGHAQVVERFSAVPDVLIVASIVSYEEQLRGRKEYRRLGKMDLRIAATALAHDGVLVTRNQRDFGQIAGLSLQDWSTS